MALLLNKKVGNEIAKAAKAWAMLHVGHDLMLMCYVDLKNV